MNRAEHLLACLAEECDEVGQRVMKALRFGLAEIQDGQPFNNAERICHELHDLWAVVEMLEHERIISQSMPTYEQMDAKQAKIAKYMRLAEAHGALIPDANIQQNQ